MGKQGALGCSTSKESWCSHCSTDVHWEDEQGENDDCKGLVVLPSSLQLYYRKKYIKVPDQHRDDWQSPTDEDYVYLDPESDPKHDNANPGTVTVEGFGLECWDYEVLYGKRHNETALSNSSDIPDVTAPQLLRRLQELKANPPLDTSAPEKEYEDLCEFGGSFGITYEEPFATRKYEVDEQILNLYMMLNRRDIFTNFTQTSSIALVAHQTEEATVQLWGFLWQMILGKELARRLECFPAGHSLSGYTTHVLGSLIAADVWVRNVDLVIVDRNTTEAEKKPEEGGEGKGTDNGQKNKGEGQDDDNEEEKIDLRNAPFSLKNKDLEMHSKVHRSQVDGLLHFAKTLSWPYLSEAQKTAPAAYSRIRNGETIKMDLWDWLFGTTLPGQWAAYKIMAALVLVSPSIAEPIGVADYYDTGLSLPKCSYWRSRTVLGRVLGGMTGVKGLCGWIGPCPPIDGVGTQGKYIRLQAKPVAPPAYESGTVYLDSRVGGWLAPLPPKERKTRCTVEKIVVEPVPLEYGANDEACRQYRASIVFKITASAGSKIPLSVQFTLENNPVFVTPPRCKGANPSIVGGHRHTVPPSQFIKFHKNVWNMEDLAMKSLDLDVLLGKDGHVLVINATGEGMETLARAWCSEKGKSAVVRRSPGPCFVCAWNVARGLGLNLLIWVS